MDRRLNKALVFAMIAVALILGVLLGVTTGIADRIFGGPNPKTIATASLESMRAENRLTVFAARSSAPSAR
jgi:ABC-type molybdate transport system substrate-binding protein